MAKTKTLLATLCDQRLTIDDCTHRNTYKFYASASGVEIECRYTTTYCPPWATAEERKPRVEKEKVKCSEDLAKMLNNLRCRSFAVVPCPPIANAFYKDMSIKFGDETSTSSFAWCFGNPPNEWKALDEFALAVIKDVHGER